MMKRMRSRRARTQTKRRRIMMVKSALFQRTTEGVKEKDKERETDRQIDRQTDRQSDRQTDRKVHSLKQSVMHV